MSYLADRYTPMSLEDAMMAASPGDDRGFRAVVTFDDGFRNNMTTALPVLRRFRIPATIYLTSSFVDGGGAYDGLIWTDFVWALLNSSTVHEVSLAELGIGRLQLSGRGAETRAEIKSAICEKLKALPDEQRAEFLRRLPSVLGSAPTKSDRELLRPLSWDEVRTLSKDPLISIGSHTVRHPILTRLSLAAVEDEIKGAYERIGAATGKYPTSFAYPNGRKGDLDEAVKRIVGQRHKWALTSVEGLNDRKTDPLEMRRMNIGGDTTLWEFKMKVSGFPMAIPGSGWRRKSAGPCC